MASEAVEAPDSPAQSDTRDADVAADAADAGAADAAGAAEDAAAEADTSIAPAAATTPRSEEPYDDLISPPEPDPQKAATDDALSAVPGDWSDYDDAQKLRAPRGSVFETRLAASAAARESSFN